LSIKFAAFNKTSSPFFGNHFPILPALFSALRKYFMTTVHRSSFIQGVHTSLFLHFFIFEIISSSF
jgi:hypothetical protein